MIIHSIPLRSVCCIQRYVSVHTSRSRIHCIRINHEQGSAWILLCLRHQSEQQKKNKQDACETLFEEPFEESCLKGI